VSLWQAGPGRILIAFAIASLILKILGVVLIWLYERRRRRKAWVAINRLRADLNERIR
jgi:hypothetical protein